MKTLDQFGRLKITGFEGLHLRSHAGGRLSASAGIPVTTADVTGTSSIVYTPYIDNQIALYDGSAWRLVAFAETLLGLGTVISGRPYDVFGYLSAGVLALEHLAWTNNTTRATAIARQDGVLVKSGDPTRRLLGTFYTISTTQTADSEQNRYLANAYNAVPRRLFRCPGYNDNSASTITDYTSGTNWQEMTQGGGAGNSQVRCVAPLDGWPLHVVGQGTANISSGNWSYGLAYDSTSNSDSYAQIAGVTGQYLTIPASYATAMPAGRHYIAQMIRRSAGTLSVLSDSQRFGSAHDSPASFVRGWVLG